MNKLFLYFNTIRTLNFIQIKSRLMKILYAVLRNDKRQWVVSGFNKESSVDARLKVAIFSLDCDYEYLKRFDTEVIMKGDVELLNECHKLDLEKWQVENATPLWNYNLHYLEFLIPLAVKYCETQDESYYLKWKEIITSWINNCNRYSFEPYTISLRIVNILICLDLLKERIKEEKQLQFLIEESLYKQYRYLEKHQERHLLANHYFENIKALVIGSVYFQDEKRLEKYFQKLVEQLNEQILEDGIHYERSLMYHKIILEDILRIYQAFCTTERQEYAKHIEPYIRKMFLAMKTLEAGFPRTPLFNDAGDNVAKSKKMIELACEEVVGKKIERLKQEDFGAAGYFRFDSKLINLIFDCGAPGPKYMSGHAHNDALSVEIASGDRMIFVNSGTGLYQGNQRQFFRSTKAHNTFAIDDGEQSELWGEHRAARKLKHLQVIKENGILCGSFTAYSGDSYQRELRWDKDNKLVIVDQAKVKDKQNHIYRAYWHLVPNLVYIQHESIIEVREGVKLVATICVGNDVSCYVCREGELCNYAQEFGKVETKEVLVIEKKFIKQVINKTIITFEENN